MERGEISQTVSKQQEKSRESPERMQHDVAHVDIAVAGMTCTHCAQRLAKTLQAVPGVRKASVNHTTGQAHIDYAPIHTATADLVAAIRQAGVHPGQCTGAPGHSGYDLCLLCQCR